MSTLSFRRQHGATLLVVLVMLVMITLFVLSMIRLSNTNLRVVGNMQAQKALASSAQQAVEVNLSTITFFNDAINNTGTWAGNVASRTTTINGYTITYTRPTCIYSLPATGYSATSNISPEDTDWELTVSSTDPLTGATTSMAQGVKMRLPQGNCP